MKRIRYLYDYMYYRIATSWLYKKLYRKSKMSHYSSSIVSIVQFFILFDILLTVILFSYSLAEVKSSQHIVAVVLAILIVIHGLINDRYYTSKYDEYEQRWSNLDEQKKNKLDLIVFLMAVIPIIYLPILTNVFDFTK